MQIFWHQRSHQPENESQSTEALSTRQQKVSVRIFWRVCVCKKRFRQGIATLSSQEKHLTGASGWNFKPFVRVGRSVFACVRLHVCAWDGLQPIENICRKINCSGMKRVRARTPLRDGPAWKPSGLQQQRPPKERERERERESRQNCQHAGRSHLSKPVRGPEFTFGFLPRRATTHHWHRRRRWREREKKLTATQWVF